MRMGIDEYSKNPSKSTEYKAKAGAGAINLGLSPLVHRYPSLYPPHFKRGQMTYMSPSAMGPAPSQEQYDAIRAMWDEGNKTLQDICTAFPSISKYRINLFLGIAPVANRKGYSKC